MTNIQQTQTRMVEITTQELNEFIISNTRWVIKNKNYTTSRWVKIVKKYWDKLDKSTQKIIRNETRGRIKQLSLSHDHPETLHYFNAYVSLLNWIESKE